MSGDKKVCQFGIRKRGMKEDHMNWRRELHDDDHDCYDDDDDEHHAHNYYHQRHYKMIQR